MRVFIICIAGAMVMINTCTMVIAAVSIMTRLLPLRVMMINELG